jgi:HD-GYP domain-containing protein (c-di-GMP phosphodiesterase class II)
MKFNKNWQLVVLVAFAQLALMLASDLCWFEWFSPPSGNALEASGVAGRLPRSSADMDIARVLSFYTTLLIGFVGCNLIVAILIRYQDGVVEAKDGLEKIVSQGTKEILKTRNAIIFGLAKLAESRDNDTGEHLDRIRKYVAILANDLANFDPQVDEQFIHNLELASSLHDIGKVGIPDSILLKPGRLSREEREIMEIHTIIGGECLEAVQLRLGPNDFMEMARNVAYSHHERWDGTGYPHAIAGDQIPLSARIVAVADVYDALTSKRPYKRALSHEESRVIIVSGSGSQFDPEVVAAFLRNEDAFKAVSIEQQNISDEAAISDFQRRAEAVAALSATPMLPKVGF